MSSTGRPAKVMSITSGKGGVGKTHTTVNVGLALAKLGKRVMVLDADLGLANINILLGFKPKATLQQVISGKCSLKDVLVSHAAGFDIIPAASGIPELTNLSEEERMFLMSVFEEMADCYDYLLIDTAAGIGDNVLHFNMCAEEILVIIDHEPTSITDAYALIKVLATRAGIKEFNIIVNRTPAGSDGRETYAQLASTTDRFLHVKLHFIGAVAEDEAIVQSVLRQKPCLELFPSSKASRDFTRIAKKIEANEGLRTPKGGIQFFFRAMLEQQN